MVKNLPVMRENQAWSLGWEDPLEKGMATISSVFAGRTPWTVEPGRLQSIGSQESDTTERLTLYNVNIYILFSLSLSPPPHCIG